MSVYNGIDDVWGGRFRDEWCGEPAVLLLEDSNSEDEDFDDDDEDFDDDDVNDKEEGDEDE